MKAGKEKQHQKKPLFIIGIDEVGRGPLAGPVMVCAAALEVGKKISLIENGVKLNDSKKLTPKSREKWAEKLKETGVPFAISSVSPAVIDKINVSNAANLAARRSLRKLFAENGITPSGSVIFLDGGLYAPGGKTVIGADRKIKAVMAASILAKVKRDKHMRKISSKYPEYGFDKHKGYGTKVHMAAIKKYGLSPIHRKTFCRSV